MPRRRSAAISVGFAMLASVMLAACVPPPGPGPSFDHTDPITLGRGGVPGNGSATAASVSADGRWTAFRSSATNLVPGDTNGVDDTFVRDNRTGSVMRIAEHTADAPTISRDGRYVGLKFADGSNYGVHDRSTGSTTTWNGASNLTLPVVTADGRAVYGSGSSLGIFPTYCLVRDLATNTETTCPWGPADFGTVALAGLSGNGRFVMYRWTDQAGTGTSADYLWDLESGERQVLTGPFASLGVSHVVSDDGSTIFTSGFGESLPPSIYDVASGASEPFPVVPDGMVAPTGISPDGRWLSMASDATNLVADDTNDTVDVFLLDRSDGSLSRVSVAFDTGAQLELGALHCGRLAGQVLDGGRVCLVATDEMSPADDNGFPDAFLTPART